MVTLKLVNHDKLLAGGLFYYSKILLTGPLRGSGEEICLLESAEWFRGAVNFSFGNYG